MSSFGNENYIGIDISKDYLDIAIRSTGEISRKRNNAKSITELKKELVKYLPCLVVIEATGGYEQNLTVGLQEANIPVAVVNPRQVRDFAKAKGKLAKTDAIDAKVLAHFAEAMKPEPKENITKESIELNEKQQRRRQLVEMLTMEKNRLRMASGSIKKHIEKTIKFLEKQLEEVEKELAEAIQKNEILFSKSNLLKSIKGIGDVTATSLIIDLPELGRANAVEIAALVGVAPFNHDSGRLKGTRSIRGGRAAVRSILYMATLSAARFNPVIREHYKHLCAMGKKKKVALVACMRKLLVIMNAMLKNNTSWSPKLHTTCV